MQITIMLKLVGIGTSTTGINATAKVTVDATGGITAVKIMDGGSAYGIGNNHECCWYCYYWYS